MNKGFLEKMFTLLLFAFIYLCLDFIIYKPLYFFTFLLVFFNIAIFLLYPSKGILMFLPFMLLSDVMSKFDIRSPGTEIASIHTMYFGPFNLFTYMILFFAFIGLTNFLISKNNQITKIDKILLLIASVYFLAAVIGLQNFSSHPREYIGDIAPFINVFCGFIILRVFIKSSGNIDKLIWILLYTFGARTLVGIISFSLNIGFKGDYLLIPFYDPVGAMSLFIIPICLSFILFGSILKSTRNFFYLLIFMAFLFMIMWPGRSNWIFLLLGLIFISFFMKFWRRLRFIVTTLISIVLTVFIAYFINKEVVRYSIYRLSTLVYLPQLTKGPVDTSQRFVEYANIFYKLLDEKNLFWGAGAGSWFDDRYIPFPAIEAGLLPAAFTEKQIQEWKFFHPHGWFPTVLLKSGLIGLFLYTCFFIILTNIIIKKVKQTRCKYQKAVLIGLYIPILTQLLGGFASKNFVMAGVLLGLLANVLNYERITTTKV